MGIIRQKMEQHIQHINNMSELEAGFTERRSITDNLYISKS